MAHLESDSTTKLEIPKSAANLTPIDGANSNIHAKVDYDSTSPISKKTAASTSATGIKDKAVNIQFYPSLLWSFPPMPSIMIGIRVGFVSKNKIISHYGISRRCCK
ncbi:hypothetical protein PIB30_058355 [Stylosanthes scabra]|uniref:Uncharacterized protein n=1 Tax=Stylosanthes scabra TaxID=79078 RepID=A0ABU6RK38_9FABA|nr:hypothetical protein [Stylosanthes scabra]